ncbi:MAG: DNA-binding protein [Bacilli bacterium]|nr:DNA-binding protein [Bacilli bacterium]
MFEREKIIELYDLYKNILTNKQREYFEYYYFEDMSFSEISYNLNVSKANIGKVIKVVENKLKTLENVLHLKEINDLILSSKNQKLIDKYLEIIYK